MGCLSAALVPKMDTHSLSGARHRRQQDCRGILITLSSIFSSGKLHCFCFFQTHTAHCDCEMAQSLSSRDHASLFRMKIQQNPHHTIDVLLLLLLLQLLLRLGFLSFYPLCSCCGILQSGPGKHSRYTDKARSLSSIHHLVHTQIHTYKQISRGTVARMCFL